MIKVSSFVVFPIMMLLSALAYPIVITMVTAKWEACVILLQIMCFTYMFQPMQILNVNLLNVKGRTDLSLRLEIFKKIVGAVVFIYAASNLSLEMLCVTDFFYTMFALVCNTYYTGKLINVGYLKQIKDILPSLFLGLLMFGLVSLSIKCTNILILQVLIGTIVGTSFYFGVSYIFKFEELKEVRYMLNRRK